MNKETLFKAIEYGRIEEVKEYIENGGDLEVHDDCNRRALILAIIYSNKSEEPGAIARLLLESGADFNAQNISVLAGVVQHNLVELLKWLVANGAEVNMNGKTPLHYAAEKYLTYDCDYDNDFDRAFRKFYEAEKCKAFTIIQTLIKHGADIDAMNTPEDGQTVLIRSALSNNLYLVKFFLKHGANVLAQDEKGRTALTWAEHNENLEMIKLLNKYTKEKI